MDNDSSFNRNKQIDIEAHPSELAIVIKYGSKREQKIIYLKDLNSEVDASIVARFVMDKCPIIPATRIPDVEQVIHYLQRRSLTMSTSQEAGRPVTSTPVNAKLSDIDTYIEMLYDDEDKTRGTGLILALAQDESSLAILAENEVLMAALARVFREDSKKNFELGTNIASIFARFSGFRQFQPMLSHHKVGAVAMQLIENELKRWEIWRGEARAAAERDRRKWDLAMARQDELVSVLFRVLINLATDLRVENKMVKRGLLPLLIRCLEHTSPALRLVAVEFLWKLSTIVENKNAMKACGIVEKLAPLLPSESIPMTDALFGTLFNVSFDVDLCAKMVAAGIVPFVAAGISTAGSSSALNLLYQLTTIDDARAMITFTDAIPVLMKLVGEGSPNELLAKGILINVTLEKRNAQLVCGSSGAGLNALIDDAFREQDVLRMKICRNIAGHEGSIQEFFEPHLAALIKSAVSCCQSPDDRNYPFGIECLGTAAQIPSPTWTSLLTDPTVNLLSWITDRLSSATAHTSLVTVPLDLLLQIIILCGTAAGQLSSAKLLVIPATTHLASLIAGGHEDDELVLQSVYCFYTLLGHPSLLPEILDDDNGGEDDGSGVVELLIGLMHDSNQQLRNLCEQALAYVSEVSDKWNARIKEERFRYHNAQWLEMVTQAADVDSDAESVEEYANVVLGAEELLGDTEN